MEIDWNFTPLEDTERFEPELRDVGCSKIQRLVACWRVTSGELELKPHKINLQGGLRGVCTCCYGTKNRHAFTVICLQLSVFVGWTLYQLLSSSL